ncbi:unnamed protein product [Chilo suppressalis]|uniref:Sodium-coupled monocarboxylate transporter 1 n=1 Tax=Chilo suppressalis TaxID=168631 RepID=A0ABN8B9R5_CHISP|nr:unnamed protein product [Chilo suppressalis]
MYISERRKCVKHSFITKIHFILTITWILNSLNVITAAPNLTRHNTSRPNISEHKINVTAESGLFGWEDYSVLAAMLIISCAIGIFYGYCGEKQTTGDDFLLGGSSMGTFPTALSLAASFITAIELLGNPAEMYMAGAQFWMICVAFILVVPIASKLYLPVFMRLRLTSCYEYLEIRFCKAIRVYASALYMLQMILYTSVAVYAPALALSDVTGLNTYLAVSLVYVVCIFYASQGGMKAVIMTDTFQSAVLIGSLAAVLALGAAEVGGLDAVWDHARRTNRLQFFDMDPDPTVRHSFWSVVVGGTMYWTSMFCANQASVQKYLSVERISQAGITNGSDRLLPLYVMRELGVSKGVPGFFVAGIFAASLGTVASALNSLAAVACQDLATGLLGLTLPEDKGALIARWVCFACGAVSFALVFAVERLGPVLQLALSFNGMAGGVSLGLFSLGMLFPWANAKGAVVGGVFGLLLVTRHDEAVFWLFRVSYLWYSGIGCSATVIVGLLVSAATGFTHPVRVPIDLLSPPVVSLLNSLPYKIKKALRVSARLGSERRRSSSVRPPGQADDKDTRRRRRLSEMAGGVFYSDLAQSLDYHHDNPALRLSEKPRPDESNHNTNLKPESTSNGDTSQF